MTVILYLVRCAPNGKVYVGQTKQGLKRRWSRHCWDARRGSSNRFHDAIRRYGPDSFEVTHVATALKEEWADEAEMQLIADYRSFNRGYNDTKGGGGGRGSKCRLGKTHTPETRARIAAAKKGRPGTRLGHKNTPEHNEKVRQANLGKKRSREAVEKTAAALRGRAPWNKGVPHTEEARRKMSESRRGVPRSPETIAKTRAAHLGSKRSDETRRRMSEAAKGRKMTPEQVECLRQIVTGRKHSAETRQRMSIIKKEYWDRKKGLVV